MSKKNIILLWVSAFIYLYIPNAYQVYWQFHTPDDFYFSGFLISDQNTYTAIFRSVIERGNFLSYSYPYAPCDGNNPAIMFQLPFTLLAWFWKMTGGSLFAAWEMLRMLFGLGFIFSLFLFVKEIFRKLFPVEMQGSASRKISDWFIVILIFGGGLAWFISIYRYAAGFVFLAPADRLGFMDIFANVEQYYAGWIFNIFRNSFHPLENLYHFFFFITALGVLKNNKRMIFGGQILACMSGVFVGIEISAILLLFFVVEAIIKRKKDNITDLFCALTIFIIFAFYYKVFLTWFPVSKSLVEQHLVNLHSIIPLEYYFPAYGVLILTTPLVFLNCKFRGDFFRNRTGRFLFLWLVAVIFLTQNDKWLPAEKCVQPAHFTRGYLYTALFLISACGFFSRLSGFAEGKKKRATLAMLALLLFFIPDNALFVIKNFSNPPHPYFLTIPKETKSLYDFLDKLQGSENIFCPDLRVGDQIPAFTHHTSIFGLDYATPFVDEKKEMIYKFLNNKDVELFFEKYKITILVIPKSGIKFFDEKIKRDSWEIIFDNNIWEVYKV